MFFSRGCLTVINKLLPSVLSDERSLYMPTYCYLGVALAYYISTSTKYYLYNYNYGVSFVRRSWLFLWFWFFYLRFDSHPPATHLTAGVSLKRRRWSRRIRLMHNSRLVRLLRLKFGIGASHLRVFPALRHGPDAQTQVRGHQTWN